MPKDSVGNHGEHSQGNASALVTLTEFADYECSYCSQADTIAKELQKTFGSELRFVFRNLPLRDIHPHALSAAAFAEAAGAQDKFWPLHDMLFAHQSALTDRAIVEYARTLELDIDRLVADVGGAAVQARLDTDMMDGEDMGVEGTPTFFINGKLHHGDWSFESLLATIERAGEKEKSQSNARRALV